MDKITIRLECLRLAAGAGVPYRELAAAAKEMEKYIVRGEVGRAIRNSTTEEK